MDKSTAKLRGEYSSIKEAIARESDPKAKRHLIRRGFLVAQRLDQAARDEAERKAPQKPKPSQPSPDRALSASEPA